MPTAATFALLSSAPLCCWHRMHENACNCMHATCIHTCIHTLFYTAHNTWAGLDDPRSKQPPVGPSPPTRHLLQLAVSFTWNYPTHMSSVSACHTHLFCEAAKCHGFPRAAPVFTRNCSPSCSSPFRTWLALYSCTGTGIWPLSEVAKSYFALWTVSFLWQPPGPCICGTLKSMLKLRGTWIGMRWMVLQSPAHVVLKSWPSYIFVSWWI